MFRNYYLSPNHYAAKWKVREVSDRHDRELINQKALELATTSDATRRESLTLEVLEAFHGYLIKYFNLIIFGQVPPLNAPQGKEAQSFLRMLQPKGQGNDAFSLRKAAKHLHLAFKNCSTSDEVYDILVMVFLDVISHYDPNYTKKTEEVCNFIEKQPAGKLLTVDDLSNAVEFDPIGCVRVLVRNGYLESVSGSRKKVQGYRRGKNWPPAQSFFEAGPVGFVYYATKWFRFYLQAYIHGQMAQLESKEHVLQLEHALQTSNSSHPDHEGLGSSGLPHAEGAYTDSRGVRWAADISMLEHWKTLDISAIDDAWVQQTDDYLFRTLSVSDRHLLQMVYVKEFTWNQVAQVLDVNVDTARNRFKELMKFLQARAEARPTK